MMISNRWTLDTEPWSLNLTYPQYTREINLKYLVVSPKWGGGGAQYKRQNIKIFVIGTQKKYPKFWETPIAHFECKQRSSLMLTLHYGKAMDLYQFTLGCIGLWSI